MQTLPVRGAVVPLGLEARVARRAAEHLEERARDAAVGQTRALAIEIAAIHSRHLSLVELMEQTRKPLVLLEDGYRDGAHQ